MSNKALGALGYGIVGNTPPEAGLNKFRVDGCFVTTPTTASAQLTGTGNGSFRVNITPGIVTINGYQYFLAPTATKAVLEDQLLEAAGNILADGESKVYSILVWLHPVTQALALKIHAGTKATTGAQVAPTVAQIEAGLHVDAAWVHLADVTVNRTGDTTVTQAQDNLVRPKLFQPWAA